QALLAHPRLWPRQCDVPSDHGPAAGAAGAAALAHPAPRREPPPRACAHREIMKLAVITSKYPARVATFFERDMRSLLEAGVEIDVFPIYPLDRRMWRYAQPLLDAAVLPRERVHHLGFAKSLGRLVAPPRRGLGRFLRCAGAVSAAALRYGPVSLAKTAYVLPKAWAAAARYADGYDHVLGYWG